MTCNCMACVLNVLHFSWSTGMSSKGIAISEKHSDEVFGEESRIGIPFNILMKDVVHFDNDLYEAIE